MEQVYAIGVSGRSGSGKTLFVKKVCSGFPPSDVTLIHQDSYYRDLSDIPLEERKGRNFDRPEAFDLALLIEHLAGLKSGLAVKQPVYDYSQHKRTGEYIELAPAKVVLLEGLLIFHPPPLRELLNLRIYMEGDDTECLIRRIRRDVAERGRSYESVLRQYQETVQPMYLKYVLPTRSYAHLIVTGGGLNGPGVEAVRGMIKYILGSYQDAPKEAG